METETEDDDAPGRRALLLLVLKTTTRHSLDAIAPCAYSHKL
jgi:hypothetical protein